jgi:hypothetical protein
MNPTTGTVMDDVMRRIRNVTHELHEVEEELEKAAEHATTSRHARILDEQDSIALLGAFKVAVDNMRRFLWAYIEAVSVNDQNMSEALQTARLMRVTELLRVLRDTDEAAGAASARGITEIVDSVMGAASRR